MAEHILKTLPPYWDAIARGDKNFEVRRDDRGFQRGDVLVLRKTNPNGHDIAFKRIGGAGIDGKWHDAEFYDLHRRVSYILTGGQFGIFGIEPGYVVMALEVIEADGSADGR